MGERGFEALQKPHCSPAARWFSHKRAAHRVFGDNSGHRPRALTNSAHVSSHSACEPPSCACVAPSSYPASLIVSADVAIHAACTTGSRRTRWPRLRRPPLVTYELGQSCRDQDFALHDELGSRAWWLLLVGLLQARCCCRCWSGRCCTGDTLCSIRPRTCGGCPHRRARPRSAAHGYPRAHRTQLDEPAPARRSSTPTAAASNWEEIFLCEHIFLCASSSFSCGVWDRRPGDGRWRLGLGGAPLCALGASFGLRLPLCVEFPSHQATH